MNNESDKPEFQLSKFNLIIAAIWYVIVVAIRLFALSLRVPEGNIILKVVQILGTTLGLFWIIFIIGSVFFRVFRRSNKAGNIVFFTVTLCWIALLSWGGVVGFVEGFSNALDRSIREKNSKRARNSASDAKEQDFSGSELTSTSLRQSHGKMDASAIPKE